MFCLEQGDTKCVIIKRLLQTLQKEIEKGLASKDRRQCRPLLDDSFTVNFPGIFSKDYRNLGYLEIQQRIYGPTTSPHATNFPFDTTTCHREYMRINATSATLDCNKIIGRQKYIWCQVLLWSTM